MYRKNFPNRKKQRRLEAQERCDHTDYKNDPRVPKTLVKVSAFKPNGPCRKCGATSKAA